MSRRMIGRSLRVAALLLALALWSPQTVQPVAAQDGVQPSAPAQPSAPIRIRLSDDRVRPAAYRGSVIDLPPVGLSPALEPELDEPAPNRPAPPGMPTESPEIPLAPNAMPAPSINFNGIAMNDNCGGSNCGGGYPPDIVGDVGPNHYVQAVNTAIAIYSKTGTRQALFSFNSLWNGAGTGTACDANNQGDPTVVYDQMADRWFVADFGFTSTTTGPFYECIAVSMSADPVAGGWWLYAIRTDDASHPYFADYPKMGIWPDGLYMTANMFNSAGSFAEVRAWAFNRAQMENGQTVQYFVWDSGNTTYYSLLPSNLRGPLPPAGTPNYVVTEDMTAWRWDVFKFTVNWSTASATMSGPTQVSQATYNYPASSTTTNIVPQTGTTTKLDTLGDRLMMQAQYRNIGGTESLWVVHTTCTSGTGSTCPSTTRIQWAQINVTGGTINTTPVQTQIYGDTTDYRWMPSIAVDRAGDMAIGFSASSSTTNPSIRWAGRLAGDTSGTLGQGEGTLLAGTNSQIVNCGGSACSRWGDYTAMTVDPADDCTFWYTNEYYGGGNQTQWKTYIGAFKFPSCTASALQPIGIWDGGGANNNTSTAANWTRDTVPGTLDTVYFNSTSSKNATIDATLSVASISVTSAYAGAITQGASNGTTNYGDLSFAGGTFNGGAGTVTVAGKLSLTGGTFNAPTGNLSLAGNFVNSGTFNANGGTVTFNGTTTLSGSSATSLNNVTIPSGKTLTAPAANLNVSGNWGNSGTFNANGGTVTFNGTTTVGGTANTTFKNLALASGATLADGGKTLTVNGDASNAGAHSGAGKILLTGGSAAHTLSGGGAFGNLELNDANGATLAGTVTVNGTLTLTTGKVTLGANNLVMGPSAPAIAGGPFSASKMIVADGAGSLCKLGTTTTQASYAFPIGDNTATAEYTPATLTFTAGTFGAGGQGCIRVTNSAQPQGDQPNYPTYLNRYWTVTQTGITGFSANTSFSYTDADLTVGGGQTEATLGLWKYDPSSWTLTTNTAVDTANNILSGAATSFSDFTGRSITPLAVRLASFAADLVDGRPVLTWETVSEQDNAGFNVYRGTAEAGPWVQVNDDVIAAAAPGSVEGHTYRWTDVTAPPEVTHWYLLEDVDLNGTVTKHGPVRVGPDVPNAVQVSKFSAQWDWRAAFKGLFGLR